MLPAIMSIEFYMIFFLELKENMRKTLPLKFPFLVNEYDRKADKKTSLLRLNINKEKKVIC